jgi:hypothetical protein
LRLFLLLVLAVLFVLFTHYCGRKVRDVCAALMIILFYE